MRALGLTEREALGAVAAFALTGTETVASFVPRLVALLADHGLLAAVAPTTSATPPPITLDAALAALFDARGLDVTVRHLPKSVAWPLAAVVDELAQVLPIAPRLTRYAVSNLGVERTLDLTAARTRLGLDPAPTSFRGRSTGGDGRTGGVLAEPSGV